METRAFSPADLTHAGGCRPLHTVSALRPLQLK